jgi:hypothetical protein
VDGGGAGVGVSGIGVDVSGMGVDGGITLIVTRRSSSPPSRI